MPSDQTSKLTAIIDDDEAMQDSLRDLLESAGLAAQCFGSAEEFLKSDLHCKAGCLIVDPAGNVLVPTAVGYAHQGNCLESSIDEIWARIASPDTIIENKRWHSVLAGEQADRPRQVADGPAGHYTR